MVLTTNDGTSMINELMGQQITEIKQYGELRIKQDVSQHLFVFDTINLNQCADTSNDGTYMINAIVTNITTKYSCAVECQNSSIASTTATTTTSAPTTNTTNETTTSSPNGTVTTTSAAETETTYVCARIADCSSDSRTVEHVEQSKFLALQT